MENGDIPSLDELALGAFLHDAGKLLQRGLGTIQSLPERVRKLESELCPVYEHRYSHKHVLFTELLFHDLEQESLALPGGLRRDAVRVAAVYHHHPDPRRPWTWLVTEADRLSAGMDRSKSQDAEAEQAGMAGGWDKFRKTPLVSILSTVKLEGRPAPQPLLLRPQAASAEAIVGEHDLDRTRLPEDYAATAEAYRKAFVALCDDLRQPADLLHEGMIGLAEQFWWAVPSSTMDEPDVPLLDHSLSVAAFATCLYRYHEQRGELLDPAAIGSRERPKFRLLRGDLSGIQNALFRLVAQQVKGVNRTLRARSFLIGQLVEAAALLVRRALGLPPYVVLMRAGGHFTMLLPEINGVEEKVAAVQERLDGWMARRYAGELALVLGLTEPLPGAAFLGDKIAATLDLVRQATERAKERPLATFLETNGSVLAVDYEEGADGACKACGVRPAKKELTSQFESEKVPRCEACHDEHELGQRLPKLGQLLWLDGPGDEDALRLFDDLRLRAVIEDEKPFEPGRNVLSAWKPWGADAVPWPVASRPLANHVPTFAEGETEHGKYRDLPVEEGEKQPGAGDLKTMAHIAADAKEPDGDRWTGRPMLAVLKADVDNLGQVFASGFPEKKRSIGRLVALSRALDWYFTGRLPWLLRERFPDTYTVYAGGDDLLLIGPWRQTVKLAGALRENFAEYCGHNPSLTLSAGIELVDAREPLNRSADRAEERLEQAKRWKPKGREQDPAPKDRLGFLGEVLSWTDEATGLPWVQKWSDWLLERLREDEAGGSFVYKLLHFLDERKKAENGDTQAAIWGARYGYHLARKYPKDQARWQKFNELMGIAPDDRGEGTRPPSRAAISIALWRNR